MQASSPLTDPSGILEWWIWISVVRQMRALELNLLQSDSIAGSTASGKAITRTVRLKMADNQRSVRMSQKKCRCKFSSLDKKKQKNTQMINEREKGSILSWEGLTPKALTFAGSIGGLKSQLLDLLPMDGVEGGYGSDQTRIWISASSDNLFFVQPRWKRPRHSYFFNFCFSWLFDRSVRRQGRVWQFSQGRPATAFSSATFCAGHFPAVWLVHSRPLQRCIVRDNRRCDATCLCVCEHTHTTDGWIIQWLWPVQR